MTVAKFPFNTKGVKMQYYICNIMMINSLVYCIDFSLKMQRESHSALNILHSKYAAKKLKDYETHKIRFTII